MHLDYDLFDVIVSNSRMDRVPLWFFLWECDGYCIFHIAQVYEFFSSSLESSNNSGSQQGEVPDL